MTDTKEKILMTALRLFARDGYEAVSVSTIAGELGMTKGALYKHYKNKRDIFDSIVERMYQLDAERSRQYEVPEEKHEVTSEAYENVSMDRVKNFTVAQFTFWTEDDFASNFRRMLTLEQYRNDEMAEYGLTNQYVALAKEYKREYAVGRILLQEKGLYHLISEKGEQSAVISGKLRHHAKSASDFPAVGDFVVLDCNNMQGHAIIHSILPRKSVFIRKAAGTVRTEQIVAANIDTVFICMSLNNDFNIRRLERYLSVAWDSGATPVIVLTKSDLCSDLEEYIHAASMAAVGCDIVVTSGIDKDGHLKLFPYIQNGKTVALIGSSGVGKSTLINRLLGENRLETNGLRNDDKGRHTTTRRELFLLKQGGMVIDTPGMRELGLWDADEGLDKSFADIEELAAGCKFRNCSHTNEPCCAIREAVFKGELSEERWFSYQKLKNENSYAKNRNEYLVEKNQKFKNIARINKSARARHLRADDN